MRASKITAVGIWQEMQDDMLRRRTGLAPTFLYMTDDQIAAVRADPDADSYLSERDGQLYFLLSRVMPASSAPPEAARRKDRGGLGRLWTKAMKDDVRARIEAGETLRSIGASYKVTPERIRQVHIREKRRRAAAETRPPSTPMEWTDAIISDVRNRRERGETLSAIGAYYGRSVERIRQVLAKADRRERNTASMKAPSDTSLKALKLTARAENSLLSAGVCSIEQLSGLSISNLLSLRDIGTKSATEIIGALAKWSRQDA